MRFKHLFEIGLALAAIFVGVRLGGEIATRFRLQT
jgi:hypothetical protein